MYDIPEHDEHDGLEPQQCSTRNTKDPLPDVPVQKPRRTGPLPHVDVDIKPLPPGNRSRGMVLCLHDQSHGLTPDEELRLMRAAIKQIRERMRQVYKKSKLLH